jgi:hypothetical protein
MVFNGNKSIYSVRLDNYRSLGLEYSPLINTTLNEKFVINARHNFEDNISRYPKINVLTIGTDFNTTNTEMSVFNLKTSPHSPLDASLFNHIPFYLKKLSEVDNYPPSDKYVLRKHVVINDITYLACYGYYIEDIVYKGDVTKYANIDTDYANISKVETNDGKFLNPVPRDKIALDQQPDFFLGSFFKIFFFFNEDELKNILDVFEILYENESLKRITELGICSSIYLEDINEVVWCTIEYFLDTDYDIEEAFNETYLEFYIEVGSSEVIRA